MEQVTNSWVEKVLPIYARSRGLTTAAVRKRTGWGLRCMEYTSHAMAVWLKEKGLAANTVFGETEWNGLLAWMERKVPSA